MRKRKFVTLVERCKYANTEAGRHIVADEQNKCWCTNRQAEDILSFNQMSVKRILTKCLQFDTRSTIQQSRQYFSRVYFISVIATMKNKIVNDMDRNQ